MAYLLFGRSWRTVITSTIAVALLVIAAVAFFVRGTVHPTLAASVADVPAIVAKLATCPDNSFAVFMFDSPFSPKGDAVNLQYSVEHGAVGLDWVLLGETNIADKEKVSTFAAQRGRAMTEREMNNVRYLRVEGSDLDKLGASIIVDLYRIAPNAQLELITEGFDWAPRT